MQFLNYGSINIDLIFSVDHIVLGGETEPSTKLVRSAGGKGANQSAALAKAGATVFHAGKIGEDGRFLLSLLQSYGVDTSFVRIGSGSTGQAIIQLDKHKQNAILLYGGGNREITKEEIDETLEHFGSDTLLVLQQEIVHTAYLIERAKVRGLSICINLAPFDDSVFSLPLNLVDLIVVNEIEGAALARVGENTGYEEILMRLMGAYPQAEILLTVGKQGAWYGGKGKKIHQDVYPAKVVDTTAAGDTFIGFYLASLARGYTVEQALASASKASALAVSQLGAMASIPLADQVY